MSDAPTSPMRKKQRRQPERTPAAGALNPMRQAQTSKALRAHYAAKYRTR